MQIIKQRKFGIPIFRASDALTAKQAQLKE
jgi:hypothetical protein